MIVERDRWIQQGMKMAKSPRVGFLAIGEYGEFAEQALDEAADKLADRYDEIGARGAAAIQKRSKVLDATEMRISALEDATNRLTNGGPPLGGSSLQSAPPLKAVAPAPPTLGESPNAQVTPFRSSGTANL